jgi:hypothetical protein
VIFDKEVKKESGVVSRRTKHPYLSLPNLGQLGWEIPDSQVARLVCSQCLNLVGTKPVSVDGRSGFAPLSSKFGYSFVWIWVPIYFYLQCHLVPPRLAELSVRLFEWNFFFFSISIIGNWCKHFNCKFEYALVQYTRSMKIQKLNFPRNL